MAYIESHQEIARHPKTVRLMRRLNVSKNEAIGIIHQLWWWAMDFAPDGDLTRFDAEEIAIAVDYDGDPAALMDALISSGWIDKNPETSGVSVHDWEHYGGKFLQRKLANAERMRNARAGNVQPIEPAHANDVQCTCDARDVHVQGVCDACALINRTEQSKSINTNDAPDGADVGVQTGKPKRPRSTYPDDFEAFWRAYPTGHGNKAKAFDQWQRIRPDDALVSDIMSGLDRWKRCDRWQRGFVKAAEIWLRDSWWTDDAPNVTPIRPELPGEESWRLRTAQF